MLTKDTFIEKLCRIMSIDAGEYKHLTEVRGMRPVRAAMRLGAVENVAQLLAPLKLAISAEEINEAYDGQVRSCERSQEVGPFYESMGVGCIYSQNYRNLVNLGTGDVVEETYGFQRMVVDELLQSEFDITNEWNHPILYPSYKFYGIEPSIDTATLFNKIVKLASWGFKFCPLEFDKEVYTPQHPFELKGFPIMSNRANTSMVGLKPTPSSIPEIKCFMYIHSK